MFFILLVLAALVATSDIFAIFLQGMLQATSFIKKKWLRITIQIILGVALFVLFAGLFACLFIVMLAFNTGKSKK